MALLNKRKYTFISKGMDPETFSVVSFKGFEAISKPYEFEILLVSEKTDIGPLDALKNPAVFTIHRDEEDDVDFNGILMQFEETREYHDCLFFKAVLVPKLWWLSLTYHNQVFLEKNVEEIMDATLKDGGLAPGVDFDFSLKESYLPYDYICQYGETHFNFISRWAQREGIYYFFEQTPAGEKVIFTDSKIQHTDLPLGKDLIYSPPSGLANLHTKEIIHEFTCKHNMLPQKIHLKDYNYLKPSLAVEGMADVDADGRGTNYIYGVHFDSVEEGNRLANIRAQGLLCRKSEFFGQSSVPFIVPGYTFDLNDHYKEMYNTKYLVTEVTHEGHQTGYLISGLRDVLAQQEQEMFYANTFTGIYSDQQFRAPHGTEKPKISGTINAKIDAAGSGEHAELDEHGRYKVILPFDRSGRHNGKASAWFRMMQPSAGGNRGMHFPLHKGTEVLLTFMDGDPDRPVIAGAMPSPETKSPVNDENQSQSVISTGKSKVDQSAGAAQQFGINKKGKWRKKQTDNYIEFEDKSDERRVRLHSQGNLWFEAQDRYGEYRTESAGDSFSEGSEPGIGFLLDNFDSSSGPYKPTGMLKRHDSSTPQTDFHNDVFKNAHVHVSSMDTVNTQEGNIYDFGGYWNYDLGNCYVEGHLDQKAVLNADKKSSSLPAADDKGYQVDDEDPGHDLLDEGGPGWTKVDWTKADGDQLSEDDIKIGKDEHWDTSETDHPGVLVEKTFANNYSYSKGNSIDVSRGDSLEIQHGGRHVEVGFRDGGSIKSWSKSESGKHWEKKWTKDGDLIYEADSNSKTGKINEKKWNRYSDDIPMISKKYENMKDGFSEEYTYCRDTGTMLALHKSTQSNNSVYTHDYNWSNTASSAFTFAAGTSFEFKMGINLDVAIYAAMNTDISAYIAGKIDLSAYAGLSLDLKAFAAIKIAVETAAGGSVEMKTGSAIAIEGSSRPAKIELEVESGKWAFKGGSSLDVSKESPLKAAVDALRARM